MKKKTLLERFSTQNIIRYFKELPSKFALFINIFGILYTIFSVNLVRKAILIVKDGFDTQNVTWQADYAMIFDYISQTILPLLLNIIIIFGIAYIIKLLCVQAKGKTVEVATTLPTVAKEVATPKAKTAKVAKPSKTAKAVKEKN
ncbi:MAG: hypothetical protein RR646_07150 [Erysipelotrichaceae bacterium]